MKQQQDFITAQVEKLNSLCNYPNENGQKFLLDYAYGGVALHFIYNHGGTCADVFNSGHVDTAKLSGLIHAFKLGISFLK